MKFVSYEVLAVSDSDEDDTVIVENDADADYFSIYGRDKQGYAHCIGDFADRESANSIKAALQNG